jgi:hypothetical protein
MLLACHAKPPSYKVLDDYTRDSVLERISYIRGLKPKEPIRVEVGPDKLFSQDRMAYDLALENSGAFDAEARALTLIGLYPKDFVRPKRTLASYRFISGYYDDERKLLRIRAHNKTGPRDDNDSADAIAMRSLRQANELFDSTLSHELVHALTDQHFDLGAYTNDNPKTREQYTTRNTDRILARRAVVEGDARYFQHLCSNRPHEAFFAALERDFVSFVRGTPANRLVRALLSFPYHKGGFFILKLVETEGVEGINEAYQDAPSSTSEILHPSRYLEGPRVVPREFDLAPLRESVPGASFLFEDTLGEFRLGLLLAGAAGSTHLLRDIEGWGGDRFLVLERPGGALVAFWILSWERETDAQEFTEGFSSWLSERYPDAVWSQNTSHLQQGEVQGVSLGFVRRGDRVAFAWNADDLNAALEALLALPSVSKP